MTTSRVLARNTVLNVMGQAVPMLAALVSIPVLIRHLGASRFGVLTLAWAAIGYFSLFDLGLGRALTQAVATRLGSDEGRAELPAVAWTTLIVMLALGVVGTGILATCTPLLIERVLRIPESLTEETRTSFYLLALSLPSVVSTAGFRGLLEAHQDFGAATALRIPLAAFTFLAPLAVLPFSASLVPIVAVLVVGRWLTWVAHLILCFRRYGYLREMPAPSVALVVPLIRYGGWMTTSNIASPIMAYLDRFFIGGMLAMSAVAHYVTPYEVVTKLLIVPTAMIAVLFPAFASTYAENPQRTGMLFERALRVLILLTFPMLLVVVLFAREGLSWWVGASFAAESAQVLRFLAVGVFANAVAQAPFALLQSTGRPDITAKLHLLELPLYVGALVWLMHRFGVTGVALAWSLRVVLDAGLLLALASRRLQGLARRVEPTLLVGCAALATLTAGCFVNSMVMKVGVLALSLGIFIPLGWSRMMHPAERAYVRQWVRA